MRSDVERLEDISLEIDKMIYQKQCELATRMNDNFHISIDFEIPVSTFDIYNHKLIREISGLKELNRYVAVTIFELKERENEY